MRSESREHVFDAPGSVNERAKALNINAEVHIDLTRPNFRPTAEEETKLVAALHAAHIAILESLEASGWKGQ